MLSLILKNNKQKPTRMKMRMTIIKRNKRGFTMRLNQERKIKIKNRLLKLDLRFEVDRKSLLSLDR
jgi:hypothetical protein